MPTLAGMYSALADVSVEFTPPPASGLLDRDLLEASRVIAEIRRRADACAAVVAGEMAHRSRRELGYEGLAAKLGARTPEKLVQTITGVTGREAIALVRVGTMMSTLDSTHRDDEPAGPVWLRSVADAVSAGRLSVEAANAIRSGLSAADETVTVEQLAAAVAELLRLAGSMTVEQLGVRARELRDDLDTDGVIDREAALRDKRYLHVKLLPDGMTRLNGLLDPESAAVITGAFGAITSSRTGGPRFTRPDDVERANELMKDERTTEQIAVDAFVGLIQLATAVDPGKIVPGHRAEVQILVAERDYLNRTGFGRIHGQTENVSIDTVERAICDRGILPIMFDDDGHVLNLGRSQRLFSYKQRLALAARDGGCIEADCDEPPSRTEAHHIGEWFRQHGKTDVEDGVLLCPYHHLRVHNNGWQIIRNGAHYSFVPPPSVDPHQRPIPARRNRHLDRLAG